MKRIFMAGMVFSIGLASSTKQSDGYKNILKIRLDSLITHEYNSKRFDGTLAIGTKDTILLFEKAIGTADRVWDIPIHLDHRFIIVISPIICLLSS